MGHSHSSTSHKRLKSVSSTKNVGGEFTEVVDFEFSDTGLECPRNAPVDPQPPPKSVANDLVTIPKELLQLEKHVSEVGQNLTKMADDEFFIYFPTIKDDLHNCWQKVYGIKEETPETKGKKHEVIDNIREHLRKLNGRLQRKELG